MAVIQGRNDYLRKSKHLKNDANNSGKLHMCADDPLSPYVSQE
jgi:hypothetical protein